MRCACSPCPWGGSPAGYFRDGVGVAIGPFHADKGPYVAADRERQHLGLPAYLVRRNNKRSWQQKLAADQIEVRPFTGLANDGEAGAMHVDFHVYDIMPVVDN